MTPEEVIAAAIRDELRERPHSLPEDYAGAVIVAFEESGYEIRKADPSMEWQPIETAPKDGTLINLLDGKMVVVGQWNPSFGDGWYFWDGANQTADDDEAHKIELNSWIPGYGPTHWMPLPSTAPNGTK